MTNVLEGLESATIIYVLLVICGLAALANCVVLLVIALNKSFRGVTEIFMGNMAVSDLMLAAIGIPIRLAQGVQVANGNNNFVGGPVSCKLEMFLPNFTISSSILTMVAISFDRYLSIVHHHKLGTKGLVATIVSIWIMSIASSSPQLYEYSLGTKVEGEGSSSEEGSYEKSAAGSYEKSAAAGHDKKSAMSATASYEVGTSSSEQTSYPAKATYISCGAHGEIPPNFETIYASTFVFVIYFLPVLLICINYVNIGRFLWKVAKATEASGSAGAVSKGKVKVVKMLGIVTAVFALLWAPYFVLFTMEEVTGTDDSSKASTLPHTIKQTAVVLSTISNPILYYVFNDKFKKAAQSAVTCGRMHSGQIRDMEASATQASQIGPS